MRHQELRERVIRPVLDVLQLPSPDRAEELLVLTAAAETLCGQNLWQIGGPALGIYQMEPATIEDTWDYLVNRRGDSEALMRLVEQFSFDLRDHYENERFETEQVAGNLYLATALARARLVSFPEAFPPADDIEGLARYWKRHWNTELGKGTVEGAIEKYGAVVLSYKVSP